MFIWYFSFLKYLYLRRRDACLKTTKIEVVCLRNWFMFYACPLFNVVILVVFRHSESVRQ